MFLPIIKSCLAAFFLSACLMLSAGCERAAEGPDERDAPNADASQEELSTEASRTEEALSSLSVSRTALTLYCGESLVLKDAPAEDSGGAGNITVGVLARAGETWTVTVDREDSGGEAAPVPVQGDDGVMVSFDTAGTFSVLEQTAGGEGPGAAIPVTVLEAEGEEETEEEEAEAEEAGEDFSRAEEILQSMTLKEKICQLFIVQPEQLTSSGSTVTGVSAETEEMLKDYPVGGVILFSGNIVDPDQCTSLISGLQSQSVLGLFVAVDEEGGSVARLANNALMGTTRLPAMKEIGNTGDPANAYSAGKTIASDIARFGFNLDFAPVADVDSNPDNPVIGDRSFASDAQTAAQMVAAAVEGFHDGGMLCTLKHFPGHGDTGTDSHLGYTELDKTLEELYETELIPFESGIAAGADFVMVGHISLPRVTGDDVPATLSKTVIDLLKEDLGFDGIVITDSMTMNAVTDRYPAGEAAVMAVQAGIDMILIPEDLAGAAEGLLDAVQAGTVSEERIDESVRKILSVKLACGILS